jgi:hypothetical protein
MKRVYVARLIGSRGRIWVAFDLVEMVRGTVGQSKRSVLAKYAAVHGAYTNLSEFSGVHSPAELAATMTDLSMAALDRPLSED